MRRGVTQWMAVAVVAGAVWALPAAAAEVEHGACRADVERLCAGVQRGGGRIFECLKAHEADVSESCKTSMAEHRARWKARHAAAMDAGTP